MKIVRRISLFLLFACVLAAGGGYAALRAETYFYPGRYPVQESDAAGEETQEQVIETLSEKAPVISADTCYLVETVNLGDGQIVEEELPVPMKYIGLNREQMIREMEAYDANPPLTELEQGFQTIELTAFSKDRVVICKYYKEEEPKQFYLMVADHFVVVYEEDRQTLYMNTDILLDRLDESLQQEIMQGKMVKSEDALYNFLESYSS
jgi:hypothetical protein